jgi:hypothetical protein
VELDLKQVHLDLEEEEEAVFVEEVNQCMCNINNILVLEWVEEWVQVVLEEEEEEEE